MQVEAVCCSLGLPIVSYDSLVQVEKVMRALFVRKLLLWPRFHLSVSETLSSSPPLVEELSVPLSKKTAKLQQAQRTPRKIST